MIYVILDTYIKDSTEREIHIRYDPTIINDKLIMQKLHDLICNEQPLCSNCVNYYREGNFCGYCASGCRIHGNIEAWDHPHHDCDGRKCPDYAKRTKTAGEIVKEQERFLYMQSEMERQAHLAKYQAKLQALKEETKDELRRKSTSI